MLERRSTRHTERPLPVAGHPDIIARMLAVGDANERGAVKRQRGRVRVLMHPDIGTSGILLEDRSREIDIPIAATRIEQLKPVATHGIKRHVAVVLEAAIDERQGVSVGTGHPAFVVDNRAVDEGIGIRIGRVALAEDNQSIPGIKGKIAVSEKGLFKVLENTACCEILESYILKATECTDLYG